MKDVRLAFSSCSPGIRENSQQIFLFLFCGHLPERQFVSKQMDCSEDLTKILYIPQTLLIYVINTYREIEKISNDCRKPKTKAITEPITDEI